jgi:hypothetical protein
MPAVPNATQQPRPFWLLLLSLMPAGCGQPESVEILPPPAAPAPAPFRLAEKSHQTDQGDPAVKTAPAELQFSDAATPLGLVCRYNNGEQSGHFAILESLGGGVAALDLEGDGQVDLFFPGGGTIDPQLGCHGLPPALFRQTSDGRFDRVEAQAALPSPSFYSHGAATGDFDADGFPDLLITGYQGWMLLINQGDGTLRDATASSQMPLPSWGTTAAVGDLNADGLDDLYVANYVNWSAENHPRCSGHSVPQDVCPPRQFQGLPDQMLLNSGEGTFVDASSTLGERAAGKGLSVLMADLSGNQLPDLYVCNDTVPNQLLENRGSNQFVETAGASGIAMNERGLPDGSMGVDLLDYDGDQLQDLWVSNFENELLALYHCEAPGVFRHVSQSVGLANIGQLAVSWGTLAFDANHDGLEDVFVANGHVQRFPFQSTVAQQPFLFCNRNGQRFVNVAPGGGSYTQNVHQGRGCVTCDVDRDGDLDIAISHVNEPVALLINDSPKKGSWLQLRLSGAACARNPVAAKVVIESADGLKQVRQFVSGGSYASAREPMLHFGIPGVQPLDLKVSWPDGSTDVWRNIPVNQRLQVIQHRPPLVLPM